VGAGAPQPRRARHRLEASASTTTDGAVRCHTSTKLSGCVPSPPRSRGACSPCRPAHRSPTGRVAAGVSVTGRRAQGCGAQGRRAGRSGRRCATCARPAGYVVAVSGGGGLCVCCGRRRARLSPTATGSFDAQASFDRDEEPSRAPARRFAHLSRSSELVEDVVFHAHLGTLLEAQAFEQKADFGTARAAVATLRTAFCK